MVDLQSISALTAVAGTPIPVFGEEGSFQSGGCGPLPSPIIQIPAVFAAGDHFDDRITQDGL
jgi:hypothetical protein